MKLPLDAPIDPLSLHQALRKVLPTFVGLGADQDELHLQRVDGHDFTATELVTIRAVLATHDPDARPKAEQDARTTLAALRSQLATDEATLDTATALQQRAVLKRVLRLLLLERG